MMVPRLLCLALILAVGLVGSLASAGQLDVSISPRSLGINDVLRVQFIVDTQGDEFVAPTFDDWTVVSTQDTTFTSYSVTFINGRVQQSVSKRGRILFILSPKRSGKLIVPSAKLMRNGRVVRQTQPVTVVVRGGTTPNPSNPPGPGGQGGPAPNPNPTPNPNPNPSPSPNPTPNPTPNPNPNKQRTPDPSRTLDSMVGRPYFIFPRLSKRELYIGDQLALHYDLYMTGMAFRVTTDHEPEFKDFFVEKIDSGPQYWRRVYLKGIWYRKTTIKGVLLTPTKEGKLPVEPLSVRFYYDEPVALKTDALVINVKPLPKEGQPENFHWGNVARNVKIEASIDPPSGGLNERFIMTVTLTGTGNVRHFKLDPLGEWPNFQYMQRGSKLRDFRVEGDNFVGTQVYTITVVPTKAGKVSVPSIGFSYFNPATKRYEVARSKPIPLLVSGGNGPKSSDKDPRRPDVLREIQIVGNISTHHGKPFDQTALFYIVLAVPPFGFMMILVFSMLARRREANPEKFRQRQALSEARRRLKEVSRLQGKSSPAEFYSEMARVLTTYLEAKLGDDVKAKTQLDLKRLLELRGCAAETIEEVIMELENCDFGRFAPLGVRSDEMQRTFERIGSTLKKLDKELVVDANGEPREAARA
ncbi:MAG: protein BatD [Myxococcales bacterium]|nr:protein BatD [Myxococcales bacterium]